MTKLLLVKEFGGLRPDTDAAFEALKKIRTGCHVLVDMKDMNRRSNRQNSYWFAMATTIFEGQEKFDDFEIFRGYILIRMGFCDVFESPDGPVAVARSLKFHKMQPDEFCRLVDATLAFAESMGFSKEQLKAETKRRSA